MLVDFKLLFFVKGFANFPILRSKNKQQKGRYIMGIISRHTTFDELLRAGMEISGNGTAVFYEENGQKKSMSY